MSGAEFVPFRARRASEPAAGKPAIGPEPASELELAIGPQLASSEGGVNDISASAMPPRDPAPSPASDVAAPVPQIAPQVADDVAGQAPAEPIDAATFAPSDEERRAALREEAIRFAAIAIARALRTALAADASVLTRYVDDALRACGRMAHATVRLHPDDAARYRPRRDVDIVADAASARGEVVIELENGAIGASIEERATLLARAAAHA